jgi:DNA-binding response OmpR family regulator
MNQRRNGRPARPLDDAGRHGGIVRIVIADHTPTLAELEPGLTSAGHEVRMASDGLAALRLARGWPPDLVLARVDLAKMDGLALAAALQALGLVKSDGLALAGRDGDVHARTRARQLGVATYLPLPVDPMQVVRAVWRAACGSPARGASASR